MLFNLCKIERGAAIYFSAHACKCQSEQTQHVIAALPKIFTVYVYRWPCSEEGAATDPSAPLKASYK